MGQEIDTIHFRHYDFHRFDRVLAEEMETLRSWFESQRFSKRSAIGGLELEAWLVDAQGRPVPLNDELIQRMQSPDVVHELSRFNIEFNVDPQPLEGNGIRRMSEDLALLWKKCDQAAAELGASVVAIGTLPTVADEMLCTRNMSPLNRYVALNEQVLRLRQGQPIRLDIQGRDRLTVAHRDVMLESAATSFQVHLQTPLADVRRVMNAGTIAAAPMVAIAANSPFLFGRRLWEETRIPLFEQAVDIGKPPFARVTFGTDYVQESVEELFRENQLGYPVLLPLVMEEKSAQLAHVRLHNGTIWRWIRPLIGFDADGAPHLRVEHRVMAAGPTVVDMAANMAFYFGLMESLSTAPIPPESLLPFAAARSNFYAAARLGMNAEVLWIDGQRWPMVRWMNEILIPLAASGLSRLKVDDADARGWLEIIERRATCGQNGARWQCRFVERHGVEPELLTREYRARQQSGEPVHTWSTA